MAKRENGMTLPSPPGAAIRANPPGRHCLEVAGMFVFALLLGAGAAETQTATTLVSNSGESTGSAFSIFGGQGFSTGEQDATVSTLQFSLDMTIKGTLASAATSSGTADGARPVASGAYVDGLRHGMWRIAHPDGSVEEGCYVAGLLHGEWVLRDPAGRIIARERWCHGRATGTGPVDEEDGLCGVVAPDTCGRSEP